MIDPEADNWAIPVNEQVRKASAMPMYEFAFASALK
jgi:hypothetical protein